MNSGPHICGELFEEWIEEETQWLQWPNGLIMCAQDFDGDFYWSEDA